MSVHLDDVAPDFHTLVDSDLHVPRSWLDDPARCETAGVPKELAFRTKWQIGLDLIARTLRDGVPIRWITADEHHGQVPEFLNGVAAHGLFYVIEVPRHVQGSTPNGLRVGRKIERVDQLWWPSPSSTAQAPRSRSTSPSMGPKGTASGRRATAAATSTTPEARPSSALPRSTSWSLAGWC